MPSDPQTQPSIETVVGEFSAAESALRTLVEEGRKLASAQDSLDQARSAVTTAERSMAAEVERNQQRLTESIHGTEKRLTETLEQAQDTLRRTTDTTAKAFDQGVQSATRTLASAESTLADTASALYTLASDLKDNARELKNAAVAFRDLDPQQLSRELATLRTRVNFALALAAVGAVLAAAVLGVSLL